MNKDGVSDDNPSEVLASESIMPSSDNKVGPREVLNRVLDLENKRIEVETKKVDVQRQAVEAAVKSDDHQFEFHMKNLEIKREKDAVSGKRYFFTIWSGGICVVIFFGFLTLMAFFGEERQNEIALSFLKYLISAVAGYGIIGLLVNFVRRNLKSE